MSDAELKPCPSCGFDKAAYEEHMRIMHGDCGAWESYSPQLISMFGLYFVECKNCAFVATWGEDSSDETGMMWNQLPRKKSE